MTKLILIDIAISVIAIFLMIVLSNLDVIKIKIKRLCNGMILGCERIERIAGEKEAAPLFADEALYEIYKKKRRNST